MTEKYTILGIVICLILSSPLFAEKEIKYPISEIPQELKENAKAVVRLERHEFVLESESKASETVKFAISVLSENGLDEATFQEFYNKFIQIGHISATVYDANGEKLHRIKQEDIVDMSASSSGTAYDDNRMKIFDPKTKEYPFTVEYEFTRDFNAIFSFPTFHLLKDFNVAIEQAEFIVKAPSAESIRILQKNLDVLPTKTIEDGIQTTSWLITNYKARVSEPYAESIEEYTPTIELAPAHINMAGIKQDFQTWNDLGAFISKLNRERDLLSEERKIELEELTAGIERTDEKIQRLYEYMQGRTRYVSIQEGIGGWQTIEAKDVDRLGYGDCKALTNYMKALLDAVGIKSYYTLVSAGADAARLDPSFPSNQFNHVILCVPDKQDTTWLECTSQHQPCGYLGTFTDDRKVLLVDSEGGRLIKTKAYTKENTFTSRKATVQLEDTGNADVSVNTVYSGIYYDDLTPFFQMDKTDKEKFLRRRIEIPNFSLVDYQLENMKSEIPTVRENLTLALRNCCSIVGSRLILPLNLMNKINEVPKQVDSRESPVEIRRPLQQEDEITYELPAGYALVKVPEPISYSTKFGEYASSVENRDNQIIYIRKMSINKGTYPAEDYPEFRTFFENISKADQLKCMLVKQ